MNTFKNLNTTQRHFVIKWFLIIFFLIVVCISLIVSHIHRVNSLNYAHYTEKIQDTATNSKYKSEQNIRKKVIHNSVNSNDPILKSLGKNRVLNTVSVPTIKNFFNVYYNWDSKQEFQRRATKIKNFTTPNVTRQKNLFPRNVPSNRHEILNNISESIISNHGNNLDLLLDCNFTQWQTGEENSSNVDTRHNSAQWWTVTYNMHTHKLTAVNNIFINLNANNGNSDDDNDTANTATESNQAGDNVPY